MNVVGAIIKQYKAYLHHPYVQNILHTEKSQTQNKANLIP